MGDDAENPVADLLGRKAVDVEQLEDFEFEKDTSASYITNTVGRVSKARRYISDPSEAPESAEVEEGPQGGYYYETGEGGGESDEGDSSEPSEEDLDGMGRPRMEEIAGEYGIDTDTLTDDELREEIREEVTGWRSVDGNLPSDLPEGTRLRDTDGNEYEMAEYDSRRSQFVYEDPETGERGTLRPGFVEAVSTPDSSEEVMDPSEMAERISERPNPPQPETLGRIYEQIAGEDRGSMDIAEFTSNLDEDERLRFQEGWGEKLLEERNYTGEEGSQERRRID